MSNKIWNEYGYDNNPVNVFKRIVGKFRKECIDIRAYRNELEETCKAFTLSTREIVMAIVSNRMYDIDDYIDAIGIKAVFE